MKNFAIAILALSILSACGQKTTSEPQADEVKPEPITFGEIKQVVPGTMFASIELPIAYKDLRDTAKKACEDEAICKVIVFQSGTVLPTGFPMTDTEVGQQIGNYTLNRNSGADELLASCAVVSDTPSDLCLTDA